jgi:hypothetical protein
VPRSTFEFNWPRIAKGCALGALVMFVWLMWPVVTCSWDAYQATPITETDMNAHKAEPGEVDNSRLHEGEGFFAKLGRSMKQCYAKTPLFGQEEWKSNLLLTFIGAGVLAFAIGKITARKNRSYS